MTDLVTYTVKAGDTLSTIARDVVGDVNRWPDIARLNKLAEPYTISPGMQLLLPDVEVLGPVVVAAKRRPPATVPTPPQAAGLGFDLRDPQTLIYLAAGALVLFALMGRK